MSFELVEPSNYLVLCHPLFLLPSIFTSIRVFSNELALDIQWPKYWSFSLSIKLEPFNVTPLLWPKMCQLQLRRLTWILCIPHNAEGWVRSYHDFYAVLKVDLVTFCHYKTLAVSYTELYTLHCFHDFLLYSYTFVYCFVSLLNYLNIEYYMWFYECNPNNRCIRAIEEFN